MVDDGSTDSTVARAESVESPVRVISQSANRGPAAARNRGMQAATGEVVAFLDADDLWTEDKLEKQLTLLLEHAEVQLVFTNIIDQHTDGTLAQTPHVNLHNCAVSELPFKQPSEAAFVFTTPVVSGLLLRNIIHTPTVVARRKAIELAGGFDESLRFMEDLNLWFEIARTNSVAYLDRICCYRRLHDSNVTRDRGSADSTQIRILSQWLTRNDVDWHGDHRARLQRRLARLEASCARRRLADGRKEEARSLFRNSLAHEWNWRVQAWYTLSCLGGSLGRRIAARSNAPTQSVR